MARCRGEGEEGEAGGEVGLVTPVCVCVRGGGVVSGRACRVNEE